jgi:hypothetical protein
MAHDHAPSPEHKHPVWLYVLLGVVVVGLAIWGVAAYRGHHETQQAEQKAEQLQQKFAAAGLPQFADTEDIAKTLGTDGGAACDTPGRALADGFLKIQLSNGADGPGQRPVTVARDVLLGELLIVQTYCPDRVEAFKNYFDNFDFDDVIKD